MQFGSIRNRLMIACAATALSLAGCDKDSTQKSTSENTPVATAAAVAAPEAALPLAAGAAPSRPPAPAAEALPPAPPLRYDGNTGDRYAYLDRAYTAAQAFGDAPPDYTYSYEQQQPLAWRSDDGYERVAEQLPDGGLRYYYYQPGAEEPYLVQDSDHSYGYSNGVLTVVYDADGNILSDELAQRQAGIAARYWARARALYAASVEQHHEAVAQAAWDQQQARIYADQQRWREQQDRDAAWQAYHDAHLQNEQAHWAMERYRRAAETARFAQTINNAVIAARADQALRDASAEARRYGHAVGALPASAPPVRSNPAAPGNGATGSSSPGTEPPRGPDAQRQSPTPGTNAGPQNPPAAPAQTASQPAPAMAGDHAGAPAGNRPNDARSMGNHEHERPNGAPPPPATAIPAADLAKTPVNAGPQNLPVAPARTAPQPGPGNTGDHAGVPVGNRPNDARPMSNHEHERPDGGPRPPAPPAPAGNLANVPVAAPASIPALQHGAPTVPTDHFENRAAQSRPGLADQPVMPATSAVAKPATLPEPMRAAPTATPPRAERSDQKPDLTDTRSGPKDAGAPMPGAMPTRPARPTELPRPAAPPTKAMPQPVQVSAHAAPVADDHKHRPPEKTKDEPTPP